jgi:hypothetical protein
MRTAGEITTVIELFRRSYERVMPGRTPDKRPTHSER